VGRPPGSGRADDEGPSADGSPDASDDVAAGARHLLRARRTLRRVLVECRRPPDDFLAPPTGEGDEDREGDPDRNDRDGDGRGDGDLDRGGATRARDDDQREDGEGGSAASSGTPPLSDTLRRATQVGLAIVLSVFVGDLLSPTRWFWAVITGSWCSCSCRWHNR
jgi:hypothetical protein